MPSAATAHQAGASLGGERGPRAEPGLSPSSVCVFPAGASPRCSSSASRGDSCPERGNGHLPCEGFTAS